MENAVLLFIFQNHTLVGKKTEAFKNIGWSLSDFVIKKLACAAPSKPFVTSLASVPFLKETQFQM